MRRVLFSGTADEPAVGVPANIFCIYERGDDPDNYAPAIDPRAHLDKVIFHSDLEYLRLKKSNVISHTDPGRSAVSMPATILVDGRVTLFAHGLDYAPLISGDILVDGLWQLCGGQAMVWEYVSGAWRLQQLWIGFSSDETNIYIFARGFDTLARSIGWRVRLYEEAFEDVGTTSTPHVFRIALGEAEFGALGKIDTDHRFVRKSPNPTGEFRFMGLPTISLNVQWDGYNTQIVVNSSNGALDGAVFTRENASIAPTPGLHTPSVECDFTGDTTPGPGFYIGEEGVELRDPSGELVFSTNYSMQAALSVLSGELVTSSHAPAPGENYDTIHVVDHDLGPAPAGATAMMGFARVTAGTTLVQLHSPFQLAGSFVLFGTKFYVSGLATQMTSFQTISPIIVGGRVKMREEYYSHGRVFGISRATEHTIPSFTLDYKLFPVGFLGGS